MMDQLASAAGQILDIACENWRPWENMWNLTAIALDFFHQHLPFDQMKSHDELIDKKIGWCLAKPGEVYCVYLFGDQQTQLELPTGSFTVSWFNPWTGGELQAARAVKDEDELDSIRASIRVADAVGAERTFLTHLTHENSHAALEAELPPHIRPAYDGLVITL